MLPLRSSILLAALPALLLQAPPPPPTPAPPPARDVAKVYAEVCAACHGPDLAGGRAPSLLGDKWTYGGDDKSVAESIREGRPAAGMPPFKAALDERAIRAMVIYLREQ